MVTKNLTKTVSVEKAKPNFIDTAVNASFALQAARDEIDDFAHSIAIRFYLGHSEKFNNLLVSFENQVGEKAFEPISPILAPKHKGLDQTGEAAVEASYDQAEPLLSLMAAVFMAGEEYERARKALNDWRVL